MNRNHIVLICGLGSSWFFTRRRYTAWARALAARLALHYGARIGKDVIVHVVSSDGSGEAPAQRAVLADKRAGALGQVVIAGHSNGVRDGAFTCSLFADNGIDVRYFAAIDTTLDNRAPFGGNISVLEEFWAGLAKTKREHFVGRHVFHDLDAIHKRNVGHVESASLPFVQDAIFRSFLWAIP